MTRSSCFGAVASRRPMTRILGLWLFVALLATACGGGESTEPTLTATRPEPPPTTAAVNPPPTPGEPSATPPTTAVPLSRTTEVTVLASAPGVETAGADDSEPSIPPPLLPDVPLSAEMSNPELTVLPPEELPPPLPPLPLPTAVPTWTPVDVLISRDDVNGVIPVYDSPNGTRVAFSDGDLWSYTYRGNRQVVRGDAGEPG